LRAAIFSLKSCFKSGRAMATATGARNERYFFKAGENERETERKEYFFVVFCVFCSVEMIFGK
jgi:hypothetical protein